MRKSLALLALPALLLGTAAAAPEREPVPCPADTKGDVLVDGDSIEYTSGGADSATFKVDPTTDDRGRNSLTVTVTLRWDLPINDYDLDVNGESSIGLQPVSAPMEQVVLTAKDRCSTYTATWAEFLVATPDNLVLTVDVG